MSIETLTDPLAQAHARARASATRARTRAATRFLGAATAGLVIGLLLAVGVSLALGYRTFSVLSGSMEPNIPVGSEAGVQNGMKRAVAGGEREQREGASGKWVAHWKMVHIVRPVWERAGQANQLGRTFPPLTYTQADAYAERYCQPKAACHSAASPVAWRQARGGTRCPQRVGPAAGGRLRRLISAPLAVNSHRLRRSRSTFA